MSVALLHILLLAAGTVAHDFHISRLTVNLDVEEARTELTLHTFVDDLELALARHHRLDAASSSAAGLPTQASLDLLAPTQHPLADSLLEAYVTAKLAFTIDGTPKPALRYLGAEAADDPYAVYLYLSAELPPDDCALAIRSRYFTELFDDQQNVVVWQRDGQADGYDLLTARDDVSTYTRP